MKKEIRVPMNIICGTAIAFAGACASIVVDKAIDNAVDEKDCSKFVKGTGRIAVSSTINSVSMGMAMAVMSMDNLNFTIGGKKKDEKKEPRIITSLEEAKEFCCKNYDFNASPSEKGLREVSLDEAVDIWYRNNPPRSKDMKRFLKASGLWEDILNQVQELDQWLTKNIGEDPNVAANEYKVPKNMYISEDDIDDFNHCMSKLMNRIGFEYIPIMTYKHRPIMTMGNVFVSMDRINDQFKKLIRYFKPDTLKKVIEENNTDSEVTSNEEVIDTTVKEETAPISDVIKMGITAPLATAAKTNMDDEVPITETEILRNKVMEILRGNNKFVMDSNQCVKILNHLEDDPIKEIIKKYIADEISAATASERMLAYVNTVDVPDEDVAVNKKGEKKEDKKVEKEKRNNNK